MHDPLRTTSIDSTIKHLEALSKFIGITRVADLTGLDKIGLPVCSAIRPLSQSLVTGLGKGTSPQQARLSAMMESIEVWHAENIDLRPELNTIQEMNRLYDCIDVSGLSRKYGFQGLPNIPIPWLQGVEMFTGKPCWVPYDSVTMSFADGKYGPQQFTRSTHGLSGGNTLLEAEIFALLEIIERDSVAYWAQKHGAELRSLNAINPETVACSDFKAVLDKIRSASDIGLWDLNLQDDLPIVVCILTDKGIDDVDPIGLCSGFSAHPNAAVAILKATLEAAQARCAIVSGAREDLDIREYNRSRDRKEVEKTRQYIHSITHYSTLQDWPVLDLPALKVQLLALLKERGAEQVVSINLSKPDFPISVTKIVYPKLLHAHIFERA